MDMLKALRNSPEGVEAMELERYWHPKLIQLGVDVLERMRELTVARQARPIVV